MSEILVLVLGVLVLPVLIGWLYGRHQADPYTTRGRRHYGGLDE